MTHLPLPSRCLTCLPPWPQAIRYAEKRLDNRSSGVGKAAAKWRYDQGLANVPIVGLSQSKTWNQDELEDSIGSMFEAGLISNEDALGSDSDFKAKASKLWLCAELLDVLPPEKCAGDPWHVPGQWGLVLGRVWEVKPVPCTGGVGCWRADMWCSKCGHVYADSARVPGCCYSCKAIFPECLMQEAGRTHLNQNCGMSIPRLELEIVAEVV